MGDVARLAGVSTQTVSRVLNRHPLVSLVTLATVNAAMQESDHRPSRTARALVTGATGLIGVLVTGKTHTGPAAVLTQLETCAAAHGCALVVMSAPSTPDRRLVHETGERLLGIGVDGIFILASAAPKVMSISPQWPVVVRLYWGADAGSGSAVTRRFDS
jgi:DNA-binding LacI/PurR family transcriptional regulator